MKIQETETGIRTKADAERIAHSLSQPSKMPGYGYSLPASQCRLGAMLRKVKGSTCGSCYALKGRYMFQNVQKAMWRRLAAITDTRWVDAMVFLINYRLENPGKGKDGTVFRWHDSGDIQNIEHLRKINEVALRTPSVSHWLPTREIRFIKEFLRDSQFAPNLTVRISSALIGAYQDFEYLNLFTSTVAYDGPEVEQCDAYDRGGECGDCRACWDPNININYPKH